MNFENIKPTTLSKKYIKELNNMNETELLKEIQNQINKGLKDSNIDRSTKKLEKAELIKDIYRKRFL